MIDTRFLVGDSFLSQVHKIFHVSKKKMVKFDTKIHLSSSEASTKQVRVWPVFYRMTYVLNHKSTSSLYDSFLTEVWSMGKWGDIYPPTVSSLLIIINHWKQNKKKSTSKQQ